jgi:hypothetical protein
VVLLNCTVDPTNQCGLHGLTAISVSCAEMITTPCPAVRVVRGQVDGATMLGSYGRYTAGAHTVLDCIYSEKCLSAARVGYGGYHCYFHILCCAYNMCMTKSHCVPRSR